MSNIPTVYANEALLLRWGDSSTNGRTVTFQLQEEDGENPFRGLPSGKNGQRVMIAVTLIGDDEQPVPVEAVKRDKSPADKAIAKAHILVESRDFQSWLGEDYYDKPTLALIRVRAVCGVASTSQFRGDVDALKRFTDLVWEYEHRQMVRA